MSALTQPASRFAQLVSGGSGTARGGNHFGNMASVHPTQPVVLVVDDDELVRRLEADVLADRGFDVVEAENADEALALLRHRRDVVVVVTDIEMPGTLNGLRLAEIVRDYWPDTGMVLASGRTFPSETELPPGAVFLQKPYSIEKMAFCVQQVAKRASRGMQAG
jgi:two-component system, response regulator PdtaR